MSDRIREPLPSLYAQDGYLSFSVGEFWELMKDSLPAADLAESLWAETPEVRVRFNELVLRKWDSFTDKERRAMLAALKVHVHNKAIDDAVTKMARIEDAAATKAWNLRQRAIFDTYLRAVKGTLGEIAPEALAELERRHGTNPFDSIDPVERDEHNNVVGPLWREVRDHWRARAEATFLAPASEVGDPTVGEVLG
jgi:hypothetical protein